MLDVVYWQSERWDYQTYSSESDSAKNKPKSARRKSTSVKTAVTPLTVVILLAQKIAHMCQRWKASVQMTQSSEMLHTWLGKGHDYVTTLGIWLADIGVIAPPNGNKPRDVLISSLDEFDQLVKKN